MNEFEGEGNHPSDGKKTSVEAIDVRSTRDRQAKHSSVVSTVASSGRVDYKQTRENGERQGGNSTEVDMVDTLPTGRS